MKKSLTILVVSFLICLFVSDISPAQEQYGNIRGKVTDSNKEPLPGVTVTLDCPLYRARSMISSSGGTFRFLNLATGTYLLKCELPGFKTHVEENIIIRVGNNFDFPVILEPASLEEDVTVVATSPIVDTKKTGAAMNFTDTMLQEVASARDPWVILQQAPGTVMSQKNVGGSSSGSQSIFISKGTFSQGQGAMYNIDGVMITDMVAKGASSRYYDFDSFEEIQIITSGAKPNVQSASVSINFITRRGTNNLQIMARAFFTNKDFQADNRTQELIDLGYVGDQINQILDYGFQIGGPIKRDKIWFWLGYGMQDIRQITIAGYPSDQNIDSLNAKLNFNLSKNNRAELIFLRNHKTSDGTEAGPSRPPETTYDSYSNGAPLIKFENEHVFSDNFLLSLKLAASFSKWGWEPKGGRQVQGGEDLVTGMVSGTYTWTEQKRPDYSGRLDGNYFMEGFLGGDHEVQFGVEYRATPAESRTADPLDIWKLYANGVPRYAYVEREGSSKFHADRWSFYINDSYSRGRLTFNLGLRFDREKSLVKESSVPASLSAPDLLPAFTFPAIDPDFALTTFSPRIGITLALKEDRKTIVRANLARYPELAPATIADWVSVGGWAWVLYRWNDQNGDDLVTTDELMGYPLDGVLDFGNIDPWNPTRFDSPNALDRNLKASLTDEFLVGVEREVFTNFSISATLTLRRSHRPRLTYFYDKETGWIESPEDWVGPIQGSLSYEDQIFEYEYWTLNRYRPAGKIMKNGPNYTNYAGFEVVATKRLSHRWMMNASFTYQRNTYYFGEVYDPTGIEYVNGRPFWPDPQWMAKLSFLYQLPWGFNFSGFVHAEEGFVFWPQIRTFLPERAAAGLGGSETFGIEKFGETRLENFYNVDLSLAKNFQLGDYGRLTLQMDAFNVFNFAHTLSRYDIVNSSRFREITEILNPRVIRLGVRYRF